MVELTRTTVTGATVLETPVRNILWVEEGEDGAVQVSALVKKGKKYSLRQLDGVATKPAVVAEWATTLLITAYDGTTRPLCLFGDLTSHFRCKTISAFESPCEPRGRTGTYQSRDSRTATDLDS